MIANLGKFFILLMVLTQAYGSYTQCFLNPTMHETKSDCEYTCDCSNYRFVLNNHHVEGNQFFGWYMCFDKTFKNASGRGEYDSDSGYCVCSSQYGLLSTVPGTKNENNCTAICKAFDIATLDNKVIFATLKDIVSDFVTVVALTQCNKKNNWYECSCVPNTK